MTEGQICFCINFSLHAKINTDIRNFASNKFQRTEEQVNVKFWASSVFGLQAQNQIKIRQLAE